MNPNKMLLIVCFFIIGFMSTNHAGEFEVLKNDSIKSNAMSHNPFYSESRLPFQAPVFDKINDSDYQPALEEGMKQQIEEIQEITESPEPATFENTIVALEKSGQLLTRVSLIFNAITSANTDSILQRVQEGMAPKLSAHRDAIFLNQRLFEKVEKIYNELDQLNLDNESKKLVDYYYDKFVHAGAKLSAEHQEKLKSINQEEATLVARFVNRLLAATKNAALVVDDKSELEGLTSAEIDAARQAAQERGLPDKWLITLQNTTQQPALQSLENRDVREKLFMNSWNRAEKNDENDTREVIQRIAKLRAEKASLLGFSDYAGWVLENQMAKTPDNVEQFLHRLIPATIKNEQEQASDIQAFINESGANLKLQPWDWNYYAEKLRKQRYNLDEDEIRSYFELDKVLNDGVFYAANRLYGITFKEVHNYPVYQKDVRVFEVYDKDGSPLALFYGDYFKRDNKSGGAWMDNFVVQSKLLGTKPVVFNVTNFVKPAPGKPALLSYDDVTTLFHEFGHALHGIFANQRYPSISGTNVPRDFVEFPSQFNEHWALHPEILKNYAVNYQTGKPIPQELVDMIIKANLFNQGYEFTELVEAADVDMAWHTLSANEPEKQSDEFETASLKADSLYIPAVPSRYRSSYFMHIWGNGYGAGYYAYIWSEMLDDDAYQWFEDNGGLTRGNGDRFRKIILSSGATADYNEIFKEFTGHEPRIEPMLKERGLQ